MKRNTDLTPSTQEQAAILALVTKIQGVLDNLSISPGSFDAAVSQNIVIVQGFIQLLGGKGVRESNNKHSRTGYHNREYCQKV